VLEPACLARVAALAKRGGSHVVFVLAVLAVHELRRHDDWRHGVEHRELEQHHRQVALVEAHETLGPDVDSLAPGGAPDDVA
jgi:hypothetical protein